MNATEPWTLAALRDGAKSVGEITRWARATSRAAQAAGSAPSRATIYRALDLLEDARMVERAPGRAPGGGVRFALTEDGRRRAHLARALAGTMWKLVTP